MNKTIAEVALSYLQLASQFPDGIPPLDAIYVLQILIERNERVRILVELNEVPEKLPDRWRQKAAKRIFALLDFYGVRQLNLIQSQVTLFPQSVVLVELNHLQVSIEARATIDLHFENFDVRFSYSDNEYAHGELTDLPISLNT